MVKIDYSKDELREELGCIGYDHTDIKLKVHFTHDEESLPFDGGHWNLSYFLDTALESLEQIELGEPTAVAWTVDSGFRISDEEDGELICQIYSQFEDSGETFRMPKQDFVDEVVRTVAEFQRDCVRILGEIDIESSKKLEIRGQLSSLGTIEHEDSVLDETE